jgi:hypothetical protein
MKGNAQQAYQIAILPGLHPSSPPVPPPLPAAHHRKAPNLPRRHRKTGLDTKGVTPEVLRLKFCFLSQGFFSFIFFFFFCH